jgi:hypothetical protein
MGGPAMKTNASFREWNVLIALVLVGCSRAGAPPVGVAQSPEALRDLSVVPIGGGYDRARDLATSACFVRDPAVVTPIQLWEATGFTLFTAGELQTRLRTAIQVGVKVESAERRFGESTAERAASSPET